MNINLTKQEQFETRHNGPDSSQIEEMLSVIGVSSLDQLISETVPEDIRLKKPMNLPKALTEHGFLKKFKTLASKNERFTTYLGMGYYDCFVPGVIQRNILENPGWYTAYTPYQAEIAQGRLEALINFQTMVMDLTGMELANASLLDEGTAAAEAMSMLFHSTKGNKKNAKTFFVDQNIFPQTRDVLITRAEPIGINLQFGNLDTCDFENEDLFGIFVQYPNNDGRVIDYQSIVEKAKTNDVTVAMAADLMSLVLLKTPGEMGADVVVGTTQRFGVPMGYGGPHAGYFATKDAYKRIIPGRIIGVSVDKNGNNAYRMALQTREQHIKREKATSNICTAQVLLAVIAGMYAVYHGPKGLKNIAGRIHGMAVALESALGKLGYAQKNDQFFDTLKVEAAADQSEIQKLAVAKKINFRYFADGSIGIAVDETTTLADVQQIIDIFAQAKGAGTVAADTEVASAISLSRKGGFLTHPVFNLHHSEHEMLRYMKRLENKDLSLVHSMISLGSCTMKLNATSEMAPLTWPEFNLHPFVPANQAAGYHQLFTELESWLSEITGFAATSLQPNSGAQGEYAGLMVIRAYQKAIGQGHRDVTLIPSSAHGTNPASAVMAGTKVVIVACDERGNIDLTDLKAKIDTHKDQLSAFMITYPSTHGVFEEGIREICQLIHDNGGQVYMDGANMNAQVGLTSPGEIGADVCHLNLHKTFCIPHGGGGPGMGPIGVAAHLAPFLPGNPEVKSGGEQAITAISAAPWGSASILTISYAYIAMMGPDGLKKATELAILNANYMKAQLSKHFKILYTGSKGRCAHEMIVDFRDFKRSGIEVEDVAKRLMDYGFHAPTVSFPVAGTLMIEPTESEPKEELDRFIEALVDIRKEISEVENGTADAANNVLKNAPHTAAVVMADEWIYPYSRTKAAYPASYSLEGKFWPSVGRVDSAYGDRNLYCSCIPVDSYAEVEA